MKKLILFVVPLLLIFALLAPTVNAATESTKQTSINEGLEYLANQQTASGQIGGYYPLASTSAAVIAFAENGSTIYGGPYQTQVIDAINYILSKALIEPITPQSAGNPDYNGNGVGIYFPTDGQPIYEIGMILPALIAAGSPTEPITSGPLVGRPYEYVVQDIVEWIAFAQNDVSSGPARGGWRYIANQGSSDNSTSQWPVAGLIAAEEWGISAPLFVKDELEYWVNYIQNPNGGSGYTSPSLMVNASKTGGLLLELAYLGYDLNDPRVQAGLAYLDDNWGSTGVDGTHQELYAMYSIFRGLEATIGLDADNTHIGPLPQDGAVIDNPYHGWNWWEDYCQYLVDYQNPDGSWNYTTYSSSYELATAWSVSILSAQKVPEPSTLLLIGTGLVGLVGFRRKFQG